MKIRDDENIVAKLLVAMSDWFADHPQAAADCRDYVEDHEDIDVELLDRIFGDFDEEYPELDLPDSVVIEADELDVEDWEDEDEIEHYIDDYLSDNYGFLHKGYTYEIKRDGDVVKEVEVDDIDWDVDIDEDLNESVMSDLAIEVREAGGREDFITKTQEEIDDLNNDIEDFRKELDYLEKLPGPNGSNFDTQQEIDETIKEYENQIKDLVDRIKYKQNVLNTVKGNHNLTEDTEPEVTKNEDDLLLDDFNIECDGGDVSWGDHSTTVSVSVTNNKSDDDGIYFEFEGYNLDDVDFDVYTDTWDDPGDYPNSVASGPLSSYDFTAYEGTPELDPDTYTDYVIKSIETDQEISKEEAMKILGIDSEDLFDKIFKKVQQEAAEGNRNDIDDWVSNYGEDYISDRYDY